jgi:cysteinyl-tRNA synthetase
MIAISDLISKYNSLRKIRIGSQTSEKIARWVSKMLNTFGLNGPAKPSDTEIGWSGIDIPENAKRYLRPLSSLRDELRSTVRSSDGFSTKQLRDMLNQERFSSDHDTDPEANAFYLILKSFRQKVAELHDSPTLTKEVLRLCDAVRDVELWNVGIYLEDRESQPALVRTVTRDLVAAREAQAERERQKQKAKDLREQEVAEKVDKGRLSHLEMFRTSEYASWDADGLPITDAEGGEVTKSKAKKLRKDWERQRKLHEAWVRTSGSGGR